MIRILILLITLNAIFPVAGFASVCASNMSKASVSEVQNLTDNALHSQHENTSVSSQMHCNDPEMSCNNQDMAEMDCDSGCCVSCLGVSASIITSLLADLLSPIASIKPVSGYINFYTRSISPELQPPLV